MISVIAALLHGDQGMAAKFAKAKMFWDEFFEEHAEDDIDGLAHALSNAQAECEEIMGGRDLGKSTMPYTCLGSLYDDTLGFEDNRKLAERIVRAFDRSMCSLEVKSAAEQAKSLYYVD